MKRNIKQYPEIAKAHQKNLALESAVDKAEKAYDKISLKSGCAFCPTAVKETRTLPFKDRHKACLSCPKSSPIIAAQKEVIARRNELEAFRRDVYAPLIYDTFKDEQPKIIDSRSNTILRWKDLFGESYSANLEGHRYQRLIAFFEGDVGPYHFVD